MIRSPNSWFVRGPVLVIAASLFASVVAVLLSGRTEYSNWLGQYVFAPIALVLLAYLIYAALFKPSVLYPEPRRSKRGR